MSPGQRSQLSGFDCAQVCAMRTADWYEDRDVAPLRRRSSQVRMSQQRPRLIRIAPPPSAFNRDDLSQRLAPRSPPIGTSKTCSAAEASQEPVTERLL